MALSQEQLNQLYESTVVSDDGETLGRVGHIYLDDHTQQPAWVTFKTGLFGTKEIFAPLQGARVNEDMIRVRYTKDYISDAPAISSDGHINEEEQAELYRYYRLDRPFSEVAPGDTDPVEGGHQPVPAGPDDAQAQADPAPSGADHVTPPVTEKQDERGGVDESPLPPPSPVDPTGVSEPSQPEPDERGHLSSDETER